MAKGGSGGKMTKLKSVIKKWQSMSNKIGGGGGSSGGGRSIAAANSTINPSSDDDVSCCYNDLHPVYVGKSRRRYLISSDIIDHPLVKELVDRSHGSTDSTNITVGCEVVLFEHLLWMLENADPQPESLEELVEFYAC